MHKLFAADHTFRAISDALLLEMADLKLDEETITRQWSNYKLLATQQQERHP
jgi:hypothetical protein